jgi:hypothetical protein
MTELKVVHNSQSKPQRPVSRRLKAQAARDQKNLEKSKPDNPSHACSQRFLPLRIFFKDLLFLYWR